MIDNFKNKTCCSVCHSKNRKFFFAIKDVPALTCAIWPTREKALACKKKDILLAFCQNCGFIENILFDPETTEYGSYYENALHFSNVHRLYSKKEAAQLIEKLNLKRKLIIDIGCGDGQFISLLCDLGKNEGIGFDPSYTDCKNIMNYISPAVHIIPEYYSEKYNYLKSDLIISRHTLEHIADPAYFLHLIRKSLSNKQTALFFEVPNTYHLLKNNNLWDIIYEHCSYFTYSSLFNLFYLNDFKIQSLRETYEKQYLTITALSSSGLNTIKSDNSRFISKLSHLITEFSNKAKERIELSRLKLLMLREQARQVALWGAGAKSVIYLNTIKVDNAIQHVVDINPRKQGYYLPGTEYKIESPEILKKVQPQLVLIINPIYRNEIHKELHSMGIKAAIEVI